MYGALILTLLVMVVVDLYNVKKKTKSDIVREPIIIKDTMSDFGFVNKGMIAYIEPYNFCMGEGAGTYLMNERLCVIVGHSKKHIEARGDDMIWLVDWNEPLLKNNQYVKVTLKQYYDEVVIKGLDNVEKRKDLWYKLNNYHNITIGHQVYGGVASGQYNIAIGPEAGRCESINNTGF